MSFFQKLFGYKDPSKKAMGYLDQLPAETAKYYDPYIEQGQNPGQTINNIGQNYQQSPGYQMAMQQALGAQSNAAAANGMAGSMQDQFQQGQIASGLASQDYNNWMDRSLGVYNTGASMANNRGEMLGANQQSKANLQYNSADSSNQFNMGLWKLAAGVAGGQSDANKAAFFKWLTSGGA